ncbi:MAG: hypothetical protein R3B70_22575 [Polyangiaceae bacterium]
MSRSHLREEAGRPRLPDGPGSSRSVRPCRSRMRVPWCHVSSSSADGSPACAR